jgi:Homeodomain-like domain
LVTRRDRENYAIEIGILGISLTPGNRPKLDAKAEARLIAEACSAAPAGRERWTLQLLADRVVQLQLAQSYSYEAVRRVLKKTNSSRG